MQKVILLSFFFLISISAYSAITSGSFSGLTPQSWANPKIVEDSSGNVYFLILEDSQTSLELWKYNGSSWSLESTVTPTMTGDALIRADFDIATDGNDDVHIVFRHQKQIGVNTDRGVKYGFYDVSTQSWSFELIEEQHGPNYTYGEVYIDVDSNNDPHVLYHPKVSGTTVYYDITYTTNSSGSWVMTDLLSWSGPSSQSSQHTMETLGIYINSNDDIFAFYEYDNNSSDFTPNIYYREFASGSWASQVLYVDGDVDIYNSDNFGGLQFDASDNIYTVHTGYDNSNNKQTVFKTNKSGSFVDTDLSDKSGRTDFMVGGNPEVNALRKDSFDNLYIMYYSSGSPNYYYFRGYDGTNWSSCNQVTALNTYLTVNELNYIVTSNDKIIIVWSRYNSPAGAGWAMGDISDFLPTSCFTPAGSSAPEMSVLGNSQTITNGDDTPNTTDDTDFGIFDLSETSTATFTVENSGSATLSLDGSPIVDITGADSDQFSVTVQPPNSVTFGPGEEDFEVEFNPTSVGQKIAEITIDNDDSDENPYNFTIRASATTTPEAYLNTVTNIDFESASITADIFNGFVESSVTFNYGETQGSLDQFVAISGTQAANTATFSVSEDITGLLPNTTYYYDIYIEANGNNTSSEGDFTTNLANAEAYSNTVTNITGFSASITFDVYNGNTFSSATIFYGEDENNLDLSQEYSGNNIAASTSTLTLSQNLTNLNPTSTYYYEIVHENANNSATSSSSSFETGFGNPTISINSLTPNAESADVNFDAFNAEQTATITYWVTQTESVYNASNSFSYDNNPFAANSATQTLDQTIGDLTVASEYFYYFEIDNGLSSASTTEASFWTLSEQPSYSNTFYQIGRENTTIELGFESLTSNGSHSYILLRSNSTPTELPSNSTTYSEGATIGNATIEAIISSASQTSTTITDLARESNFIFTLIPFNVGENEATAHYLTDDAPTVSGFTIPTLGEWGMIAFGGLMLVVGTWYVRRTV